MVDEMSSCNLIDPGTIGELPPEADLMPFAERPTSSSHCTAYKFSDCRPMISSGSARR